ncbi:MAG TPA: SdpI family protein [Flavipsychrobacter sp.]|jgi:uncharacterized membrane protein|nr:SdpI family protein [Flavipsychrobacter sp.]
MKAKQVFKHIGFTVIMLLPLLYLFLVWGKLPEQVPTHFNIRGLPDEYSSRSSLAGITVLLCVIVLICYYLLHFLYKIDPRLVNKPSSPAIEKIAVVVAIFLTAINFTVLFSSLNPAGQWVSKLKGPLLGLLLTFLGYYMYSLKSNYFVGIRVPWTLDSNYNWRKTHQLAGVIFFIGGLSICIASLLFSPEITEYFLMSAIVLMVIIPTVYSFILFKNRDTTPGYFNKET